LAAREGVVQAKVPRMIDKSWQFGHKTVELTACRWPCNWIILDLSARWKGDHCPQVSLMVGIATFVCELSLHDDRHTEETQERSPNETLA
jgi:hypothetical protein